MTADAAIRSRPLPRIPVGGMAVFLVAVAFLAGVIHICTILLVPSFARTDGWSRLAAFAGEDEFTPIPVRDPARANVAGLDPLFVNAACRLRLGATPVGIAVEARDRFWSLALYDRKGTIIFSLNDRTAIDGQLDMMVVTPAQHVVLRQSPPASLEQTVIVESRTDDLIAVLRLFAPTPSAQEDARPVLAASECLPAPLEGAPSSGR